MIHIISITIALIIFFRLYYPLAIKRKTKVILMLVLLAVALKHLAFQYLFGGLASPELPFMVIAGSGALFGALLILLAATLAKDLIKLLLWPFKKLFPTRPMISQERVALLITAMALLTAFYGTWQGVKVPALSRTEVILPGLPAELDGLKMVVIADIHASRLLTGHRTEKNSRIDQLRITGFDIVGRRPG